MENKTQTQMDDESSFVKHVWGWVNNDHESKRKLGLSIRNDNSCLLSIPYIEPILPSGLSDDAVQCYYLVAGLIALSPNCEKGNMGHHLQKFAEASNSSHMTNTALGFINRAKNLDQVSARHCIKTLVRQLGSHGISVNHAELLRDLLRWKSKDPLKKWMSSFFRASKTKNR